MNTKEKTSANAFATASAVFGILAFLTGITVVLVPFNAGLSITFALLSRGNRQLPTLSVLGIVFSCISLLFSAVFLCLFGFLFFEMIQSLLLVLRDTIFSVISEVGRAGAFYA